MSDYTWPSDLAPFAMSFYVQPHVVRSVSPFTRQQKLYELNAPLWVCKMSFRGGYDGTRKQDAFGPRLDAWIAKLRGGVNRVAIYDFRRWKLRGSNHGSALTNDAASIGGTSMTVAGFAPYSKAFYPGDYIGGDGRPHLVTDDNLILADSGGEATVNIWPPLAANIASGAAVYGNPPGWFRLVDDDAGTNPVVVGELVTYDLEFIEDLAWAA